MAILTRTSKSVVSVVLLSMVGLVACAEPGGTLGDSCSSSSDCDDGYRCVKCSVRNACYFDSSTKVSDDVWACKTYGSGTALSAGSSSSSGSSSTTGACAYIDSQLNRIVCGQKSSGSCSGKYFGTGTSCSGLSCSSTSVSSCTVSGSSSSTGGSTTGGTSAGSSCVGTNEICNSNTVNGCVIKFCAGGSGGCYYVADGKRFSCNGDDIQTCGANAAQYCADNN